MKFAQTQTTTLTLKVASLEQQLREAQTWMRVAADVDETPSLIITPSEPADTEHALPEVLPIKQYDDLEISFRELQLSLQSLRNRTALSSYDQILTPTLERLNDYLEDARVELEIRLTDSTHIMRTEEGAKLLERKGDDLRHDIDELERVLVAQEKETQELLPQRSSDIPSILPSTPPSPPTKTSPLVSSWTSFLPISRPSSPAPPPTFGDVMSTHLPAIRRQRSLTSSGLEAKKKESTDSPFPSTLPLDPASINSTTLSKPKPTNPALLEGLNLRIALPSALPPGNGLGEGRQRTTSLLGFGPAPRGPFAGTRVGSYKYAYNLKNTHSRTASLSNGSSSSLGLAGSSNGFSSLRIPSDTDSESAVDLNEKVEDGGEVSGGEDSDGVE